MVNYQRWHLNSGLSNDISFVNFVEEKIKQYLEFNVSPEISPVALWECTEAYLRGHIIAFAPAKKKLNEAHRFNL